MTSVGQNLDVKMARELNSGRVATPVADFNIAKTALVFDFGTLYSRQEQKSSVDKRDHTNPAMITHGDPSIPDRVNGDSLFLRTQVQVAQNNPQLFNFNNQETMKLLFANRLPVKEQALLSFKGNNNSKTSKDLLEKIEENPYCDDEAKLLRFLA